MLQPSPPLVILTNGNEIRLIETHTGLEWLPADASETAFRELVEAVGRASSHDLKEAIGSLMGTNSHVWMQAVRQASAATIRELSGSFGETNLPFVEGLLFPREATAEVIGFLHKRSRLITVEGSPLAGKSSVLRDLVDRTTTSSDLAVLFLEAETGRGPIQAVADILRDAFSWPVTRDEAREWLLRVSKAEAPALVLALDGLERERADVKQDVEDLTSAGFGESLKIVAALDDVVADRLVLNSTSRKASAIGRRAKRVRLGPLSNAEFEQAVEVMRANRLGMMHGASHAEELRIPWVLRAVASRYEESLREAPQNLLAGMPPLLSLELIAHAREQFTDDELRRLFRGVAKAVIQDAADRKRSVTLILQSLAAFVVRRSTLRQHLEADEIKDLLARGLVRSYQPPSGEALLTIRLSELLASEIGDLLGEELATRAQADPEKAASWIGGAAGAFPLGDLVAAQAICDGAIRHGGLPLRLIVALLETSPKRHAVAPGTRSAIHLLGVGTVDLTFREGGALSVDIGGRQHVIEPDGAEEEHVSYGDFHPWLVLSHLAGRPFIAGGEVNDPGDRLDPALLLEVGACATVLRRPGGEPSVVAVLTHDVPGIGTIACYEAGIVEAITWSMFRFLSNEGDDAEPWVVEAAGRKSLPLLARVDIALRCLSGILGTERAAWAKRMLETVVRPAFRELPALH